MKTQLMKIIKGAVIAGVGATVIFAAEKFSTMDFGEWSVYVGAICAVATNVVRKMIWKP